MLSCIFNYYSSWIFYLCDILSSMNSIHIIRNILISRQKIFYFSLKHLQSLFYRRFNILFSWNSWNWYLIHLISSFSCNIFTHQKCNVYIKIKCLPFWFLVISSVVPAGCKMKTILFFEMEFLFSRTKFPFSWYFTFLVQFSFFLFVVLYL